MDNERCSLGRIRHVYGSDSAPWVSSDFPQVELPVRVQMESRVDPRRGERDTGGIEVEVPSLFYPEDFRTGFRRRLKVLVKLNSSSATDQ